MMLILGYIKLNVLPRSTKNLTQLYTTLHTCHFNFVRIAPRLLPTHCKGI